MGKLFDKLNNSDAPFGIIEKYLLDRNFYRASMSPRFINGSGHGELTLDEPCLRNDLYIKDDYTLRIFINEKDIYYEVQNPWRSYECSSRYNPEDYPAVEDIDKLLDEIVTNALESR